MPINRSDGVETRSRLLKSAGAIFADKGFRDATTADICRMAKANIAAVNYHFGCKDRLYVEAWRHAFERSLAALPPDGGVPIEAPAEERLRGQIVALVRRIMDPDNLDFDIGLREMAQPTGLLAEVMRRSIDPLRRALQDVVREIIGPRATDLQVRLCETSIHAQCFSPLTLYRRRSHRGHVKLFGPEPLALNSDALADHIFRFSLAGIHEVRRVLAASRNTAGISKMRRKKGAR